MRWIAAYSFRARELLVCAVMSVLCVGCASGGDRFSLEVTTDKTALPLGQALVRTPAGGPPVIAVTQTSYSNAIVQTIVLPTGGGTPGQNAFVVSAFQSGRPEENDPAALQDRALSSYAIGRELEREFPGIEMLTGQAYTQNKYGPFGHAFGRPGNGDLCFYGWQRIERTARPLFSWSGGVISIRLRLCERNRTEADLLRVFYGFTFVGRSTRPGWDPFDEPPGPPPALGATSSPIYPIQEPAADERRAQPARETARVRTRVRDAPPPEPSPATAVEVEPLPGYPTVPAPPGAGPTDP